jgi:enoyl-CoA hydratase/carnithine racemase
VSSSAPEATEPAALLERRGPVALFTLNRPRALNAVNWRPTPRSG